MKVGLCAVPEACVYVPAVLLLQLVTALFLEEMNKESSVTKCEAFFFLLRSVFMANHRHLLKSNVPPINLLWIELSQQLASWGRLNSVLHSVV